MHVKQGPLRLRRNSGMGRLIILACLALALLLNAPPATAAALVLRARFGTPTLNLGKALSLPDMSCVSKA